MPPSAGISWFFQHWYDAKRFIEYSTTISHDTLHLVVGFAVWIVVMILSRRPAWSIVPLAVTFLLILFNEVVDLWVEIWPDHARQAGEGIKDLALTIAIPAALFACVRLFPNLFVARSEASSEDSSNAAGPGAFEIKATSSDGDPEGADPATLP